MVRGTDALDPLARFRYRPMVFVTLRLRGRGLLPDTVVWTPEARFPFFRVTDTTRSMPWLAPEGKSLLTADLGCEVGDATWGADDAALADRVLDALDEIVPGVRARDLGGIAVAGRIDRHVPLEAVGLRVQQSRPFAGAHLRDQPSGDRVHRLDVHAVDRLGRHADRARARRMGEAGAARVAKGFLAEQMVDAYEALYREILAEAGAAESAG